MRPDAESHLDEVVVHIHGRTHQRWRAVDQDGHVLESLVQSRRDTDKLASYGTAQREMPPSVEHRRHHGLNNRAEQSHRLTRERERAQRFLAA